MSWRVAVIEQAIEWRQRINQGEMDPDSQRQLQAWLETPAHAEELANLCYIDMLIERDPLLKRELPPALPENVIPLQSYALSPRAPASQPPGSRSGSGFKAGIKKTMAIAACLGLAVLIAVFNGRATSNQDIDTQEGRWDKQQLMDGSVVNAGPRTRLHFKFDAKARRVTQDQGEALFQVAKDPGRPFMVKTAVGTVQAIGTVFAISYIGDDAMVTVASGKVAVSSSADAQPIVTVGANQQVVLTPSGVSEPVTVNAKREIKWIRNWYEYDGERLGEIIAQLNRRHEVKVIVDDPRVAHLRMSSLAFKPSEPEVFVTMINEWYAGYLQKSDNQAGQRGGAVLHLQRP